MKKAELIFNLISVPFDAISLLLASLASFYLRKHTIDFVGPIVYNLELTEFMLFVYEIIPVLLIIFALLGLYNLTGTRKFVREFGKIIIGVSLGLLLLVILFFFDQSIFPSRFIILVTWILGIIFVMSGRLILRFIQVELFKKGIGLHKLAVIRGRTSESLAVEAMYKNPENGYEVTSEMEFSEEGMLRLEKLYFNNKLDEILQANASLNDEQNLRLVQFARDKGLKFSFVPNLFEVQSNIIETSDLNGIPVISLKNTPLDGWGKVAKRILDILASFVCLVLTSPLFVIVSLAIKFGSPGKVIYSAPRGGRGKNFSCYKFRSMYSHLSVGEEYGGEEAEKIRKELWQKNDRGGADGPFLKIKGDPRVTRIGRFLRKTKLDEIPQFWNVFVGDMSMVGPRAHVLDEVERYRSRYPRMFSIKPGIFGLSQTAQMSWPDLPFEEEIKLNISYIENWSLWLDMKILGKSFWLLFFGPKAKGDY